MLLRGSLQTAAENKFELDELRDKVGAVEQQEDGCGAMRTELEHVRQRARATEQHNAAQHEATQRNTLQRSATRCNAARHSATCCSTRAPDGQQCAAARLRPEQEVCAPNALASRHKVQHGMAGRARRASAAHRSPTVSALPIPVLSRSAL